MADEPNLIGLPVGGGGGAGQGARVSARAKFKVEADGISTAASDVRKLAQAWESLHAAIKKFNDADTKATLASLQALVPGGGGGVVGGVNPSGTFGGLPGGPGPAAMPDPNQSGMDVPEDFGQQGRKRNGGDLEEHRLRQLFMAAGMGGAVNAVGSFFTSSVGDESSRLGALIVRRNGGDASFRFGGDPGYEGASNYLRSYMGRASRGYSLSREDALQSAALLEGSFGAAGSSNAFGAQRMQGVLGRGGLVDGATAAQAALSLADPQTNRRLRAFGITPMVGTGGAINGSPGFADSIFTSMGITDETASAVLNEYRPGTRVYENMKALGIDPESTGRLLRDTYSANVEFRRLKQSGKIKSSSDYINAENYEEYLDASNLSKDNLYVARAQLATQRSDAEESAFGRSQSGQAEAVDWLSKIYKVMDDVKGAIFAQTGYMGGVFTGMPGGQLAQNILSDPVASLLALNAITPGSGFSPLGGGAIGGAAKGAYSTARLGGASAVSSAFTAGRAGVAAAAPTTTLGSVAMAGAVGLGTGLAASAAQDALLGEDSLGGFDIGYTVGGAAAGGVIGGVPGAVVGGLAGTAFGAYKAFVGDAPDEESSGFDSPWSYAGATAGSHGMSVIDAKRYIRRRTSKTGGHTAGVDDLQPDVAIAVAKVMMKNPGLSLSSGARSHENQRRLFLDRHYPDPNGKYSYMGKKWSRRAGEPPTAVPGTSNHEAGLAIDFKNYNYDKLRRDAQAVGLHQPMTSEPWHWEPPNARSRRKAILGGQPDPFAASEEQVSGESGGSALGIASASSSGFDYSISGAMSNRKVAPVGFGGGAGGGSSSLAEPSLGPMGDLTGASRIGFDDAYQLARQAGFSHTEAVTMAAIAKAESGLSPQAHNPNASTGDNSYGLWQINMIGAMKGPRQKQFGITSNAELFNPYTNARAAKAIYDSQGFRAWSVYKSGAHRQYVDDVHAAISPSGKVGDAAETVGFTENLRTLPMQASRTGGGGNGTVVHAPISVVMLDGSEQQQMQAAQRVHDAIKRLEQRDDFRAR